MNSFFNDREDKSEQTLSRLSENWNGGKPRKIFGRRKNRSKSVGVQSTADDIRFESGPVKELSGQFSPEVPEFKADTLSKESNIELTLKCDAKADKTLNRLSQQWSGGNRSGLPTLAPDEDVPLEKQDLAKNLSKDEKVGLHHIDEEVAPSLLVDWKLWGIKIAIFILIPIFLVMGGGIKHVSNISPAIATYCHTQALLMQETFEGKASVNSAKTHYALAEIYMKQKENRLAVDHAHKAAKIYTLNCLEKINKTTYGNWKVSYNNAYELEPSLSGLRKSLVLGAKAAKERKYIDLSNRYWRLAISLDPYAIKNMKLANKLIENRLQAAESFAAQKNKKDAIKAIKGAFNILPYGESRQIYYNYDFQNVKVTKADIEAFQKAGELHYILNKYYSRFGEKHKAYKERRAGEQLYKHLAYYLATKELNPSFTPPWPAWTKKDNMIAHFYLGKGEVTGIYASPYKESTRFKRKYVREHIERQLNYKRNDRKKVGEFYNFIRKPHPGSRIELQVKSNGFQVDEITRNEKPLSLYMKPDRSSGYLYKDFRKAIVKISISL